MMRIPEGSPPRSRQSKAKQDRIESGAAAASAGRFGIETFPNRACFIDCRRVYSGKADESYHSVSRPPNFGLIAKLSGACGARGWFRKTLPCAGDEFLGSFARLELGDCLLKAN